METVKVRVEINWGRRWTGSYYELTPGEGVTVNVSEESGGNSFRGCPEGRTTGESFTDVDAATAAAMADFVFRGRTEYKGAEPLTVKMLTIVRTSDYRRLTAK